MGKRTGGKRGAPYGNRNAVKLGLTTAKELAWRKEWQVHIQFTLLMESLDRTFKRIEIARRAGVDVSPCLSLLKKRLARGPPPEKRGSNGQAHGT